MDIPSKNGILFDPAFPAEHKKATSVEGKMSHYFTSDRGVRRESYPPGLTPVQFQCKFNFH
jgi:hypothetical protein